MNIHNNYSSLICTKNFMIFCAKFLLTRQIVCAILKHERRTKRTGKQAGKENENEKVFLCERSGFQG